MQYLTPVAVAVPLLIIFWFTRELLNVLRPTLSADMALPNEPIEKADYLIAVSIAVVFYVVCLWRLGQPQQQYFDEVHHVRTAMEYIWGQNPHEWSHPPLAKLIMAGSMKLFGVSFNPSGWSVDGQNGSPGANVYCMAASRRVLWCVYPAFGLCFCPVAV